MVAGLMYTPPSITASSTLAFLKLFLNILSYALEYALFSGARIILVKMMLAWFMLEKTTFLL